MSKGLRVYIAGPISKGNTVKNVKNAIEAGERVRMQGHAPFIPHLTTLHWYFLYEDRHSIDNKTWHHYNMMWLEVCDVLIRLPGESSGSDEEVAEAIKLGIPVYYSVEDFLRDSSRQCDGQ